MRCRGVVLLVLVLLISQTSQGALPHVTECNFCMKCNSDGPAAEGPALTTRHLHGAAAGGGHAARSGSSSSRRMHGDDGGDDEPFTKIFPNMGDVKAKALKPNCTECRGCSAQLQPLKAVSAFGQDFNVELGASPEWIFKADLPDGSKGIVKVWCMPIDKVHGTFKWSCEKSDNAMLANQFLLAQHEVLKDCGLLDVTIKVRVAPVNAVVPGSGLHIWWNGLWMERAEGISLNQLSYITRKTFVEETIMSLLQVKLNHTRVIQAAMLDLLTSQCDRHSQNVFINENGQIKLIDNLQALKFSWINCALDSIFLPGTQKNEVVRFGGNAVGKKPRTKPRRSVNPMLLMDYRCYAPGGKIGTDYPPELTQCLKSISSMTMGQLMDRYNFPLLRNAEVLQSRAKDMLEKGFEWTLQRGAPTNADPKRYRWHQPCCKLRVDKHVVTCGHPWNVTAEFPKGDPLRGTNWTESYPDPGTYIGGTEF